MMTLYVDLAAGRLDGQDANRKECEKKCNPAVAFGSKAEIKADPLPKTCQA
jgi:hypothetical protein